VVTTALVLLRCLASIQVQDISHRKGLGIGQWLMGWWCSRRVQLLRGFGIEEAVQVVGDPIDGAQVATVLVLPTVQAGGGGGWAAGSSTGSARLVGIGTAVEGGSLGAVVAAAGVSRSCGGGSRG